ncbi:MAG: cell division protein ZapA [Gammaproteobacteria bacterium]|nr:cell division protein ZapA [Gammaproteobacteria bacterium]
MNAELRPVTITILDKEYLISCREDEREQLHEAAAFLNDKMGELKSGGKVVGIERIAVMAALNIASELLSRRAQNEEMSHSVDSVLRRLSSKIDAALRNGNRTEM